MRPTAGIDSLFYGQTRMALLRRQHKINNGRFSLSAINAISFALQIVMVTGLEIRNK